MTQDELIQKLIEEIKKLEIRLGILELKLEQTNAKQSN